jgi:16S rRNA (cytosine967-C5)-methyltransferase
MTSPPRARALEILSSLDRGKGTLADRLADAEVQIRDPRDRSFLHELVLGTLRHRGALDHALRHVSDRPPERLRPAVLAHLLRLGAYQILRMRVPAHAAVSESVELARQAGARGAASFANAVLRRLAREGPAPAPDPDRDPLEWLKTEGSLPTWLAERWLAQLGPGPAVARARAFLDHAPVVFRLNPRAPDAWARVLDGGLDPEALTVPGAFRARGGRPSELAAARLIYLQDEGSQLAAHLAAHGRRLLDACAAPGGKSTLMADLLGGTALVVAAESSPVRLRKMAGLVRSWGASNVACVAADGLRPPFAQRFDSVLVDAPCSGLATLGRHPDIRWRFGQEQLAAQAERQRRLLLSLAALVAPGGRLVYSTCSLEPEETTSVCDWFLDQDRGFDSGLLPDWATPFRRDGASAHVLPERDDGDGFFMTLFRHRDGRP